MKLAHLITALVLFSTLNLHCFESTQKNVSEKSDGVDSSSVALENSALSSEQIKDSLLKALSFLENREYSEAQSEYEKIIAIDPDNREALVGLSTTFVLQEQHKEARNVFETALSYELNDFNVYYYLAQVCAKGNEYDDAILYCRKAVEIHGPDHSAIFSVADILIQAKNNPAAIEILEIAESSILKYPENLELLGHLYWAAQDYERAEKWLTDALVFTPTNLELLLSLSLLNFEIVDMDDAEMYAKEALEESPFDPDPHLALGKIYMKMKDLDGAKSELNEAIRLGLNTPEVWDTLGKVHLRKRELSEAERCLLKAVEINPDYVEGHVALGTVYYEMKLYEKAKTALYNAIALGASDLWEVHYTLILVLQEVGELDQVSRHLEKLKLLNPDKAEEFADQ